MASSSGSRQNPSGRAENCQAERTARRICGVLTPGTGGGTECVIELEGPRGKMRIQWKGITPPIWPDSVVCLWESA